MPLATWLTFFVAVLTLLLTLHQQQAAPRTITPQQVEEIITRVEGELEAERNPDPKPKTKTKATTKTKAKAPGKGVSLRPSITHWRPSTRCSAWSARGQ